LRQSDRLNHKSDSKVKVFNIFLLGMYWLEREGDGVMILEIGIGRSWEMPAVYVSISIHTFLLKVSRVPLKH